MKITHLNFAKGFRGGERQTLLLIDELSKNGFIQKLVVRNGSKLISLCKNIKNLEIVEISKPYILSLYKIKNDTILHSHETKASQFCYFANFFFRIPYIVTRRVDNKIKNNYFTKAIYNNAKYTVAISSSIKKRVEELSSKVNIVVIPDAYANLEKNITNIANIKHRFKDKFLIGNIAELQKEKGQIYLIEAVKDLSINYKNLHLIFLGKGSDENFYRNQTKNYTNFTFEGFVPNVGDYIECFDLFVFPSLMEGLGSTLLDVMIDNKPIIATNVGGIVDIIKDRENGILVEAKSISQLKDSIKELYENSTLREKLANNAKKSVEYFSKENMAKRYQKLYENEKE